MQGFKGLIGKNLQTDDAFVPIMKKIEEYRKATQTSIDYFQMVHKVFDSYTNLFQKGLQDNYTEDDITPQYYQEFLDVFEEYNSQLKIFSESILGTFRDMTTSCGSTLTETSNQILGFQHQVRDYQVQEGILCEMSKKYFRSLKTIQSSIESYKTSFTDVKLIYNSQQRLRRYNSCLSDYQTITEEYLHISQKVEKLNQIKQSIIKTYQLLYDSQRKMIRTITTRKIAETKNFTYSYCGLHKNLLTALVDKKIIIEKLQISSILTYFKTYVKPQYFNCQIKPEIHNKCPPILFYHAYLKDQYLHLYSRILVDFIKQVNEKIQNRKLVNKKILQFQQYILRIMEKAFFVGLRQAMSFFQKNKKKISQNFGKKVVSFLKSINSILELALGINEKLLKSINSRILNTQIFIQQDSKLLDLLLKQLNSNIQTFIGKKQLKKIKNSDPNNFTEEQTVVDIQKYRNEVSKKAEFLMLLLVGFEEKMNTNYEKIRKNYNETVHDIFLSNNQLYSLSLEYQSMYFGAQQFQVNFHKYEIQIESILVKQKQFYEQINFGVLLKDKSKIVFEGEVQKYQEFKKLKKPLDNKIQNKFYNQARNQGKSLQENQKNTQEHDSQQLHHRQAQIIQNNKSAVHNLKDPKDAKYMQILLSKVALEDGEQLIKTFACGLSDKIILQGRLYITTQRFCFHSKFNPSNVFFGGTFIQVPKKDIKKIEKRINAIFFDNSISITTINGEIFLTSFFSRDQAYNLLCKNFQINQDQAFEQENHPQSVQSKETIILPQIDDITQQEVTTRANQIDPLLNKFVWRELFSTQIEFPGITPYLIFKLFFSWQQITINRKKHKSFLHYVRETEDHKDIDNKQWVPNILQYMNAGNIKSKSPLQFQTIVDAIVPVPNSGIPFIPKTAKSHQQIKTWIYSKDKIVMDSNLKTSGAPFADTFELYSRTIISTVSQNKCQIIFSIYLNILKRTIATSTIQTRTFDDSLVSVKHLIDLIKKYLKNVQSEKNKLLKKQNQAQSQKLQNNVFENEINELSQTNKKLQKQLKQQSQKSNKNFKLLIGSVLLNLFFILIILSY